MKELGKTFGSLITFFLALGVIGIFVGGVVFIVIAILSSLIVPLTWAYGELTDQSYARVCDNSQILYDLNKIGKFTLIIYLSIFLMYLIFKTI